MPDFLTDHFKISGGKQVIQEVKYGLQFPFNQPCRFFFIPIEEERVDKFTRRYTQLIPLNFIPESRDKQLNSVQHFGYRPTYILPIDILDDTVNRFRQIVRHFISRALDSSPIEILREAIQFKTDILTKLIAVKFMEESIDCVRYRIQCVGNEPTLLIERLCVREISVKERCKVLPERFCLAIDCVPIQAFEPIFLYFSDPCAEFEKRIIDTLITLLGLFHINKAIFDARRCRFHCRPCAASLILVGIIRQKVQFIDAKEHILEFLRTLASTVIAVFYIFQSVSIIVQDTNVRDFYLPSENLTQGIERAFCKMQDIIHCAVERCNKRLERIHANLSKDNLQALQVFLRPFDRISPCVLCPNEVAVRRCGIRHDILIPQ